MKTSTHITATLALALLAGAATPAFAQDRGDDRRDRDERRDQRDDRHSHYDKRGNQSQHDGTHFRAFTDLKGSPVVNGKDETLGDVHDFIVDRGSGEIQHVILSHGGFMGYGDTEIAVPYERFNYKVDQERFVLRINRDNTQRYGENTPQGWVKLTEDSWTEQLADWRKTMGDRVGHGDPFQHAVSRGNTENISGTITQIDRIDIEDQQFLVATIEKQNADQRPGDRPNPDGNRRNNRNNDQSNNRDRNNADRNDRDKLVLGPSWFVSSQDSVPQRGDTISAEGLTSEDVNRMIERSNRDHDARERNRDHSDRSRHSDHRERMRDTNADWFIVYNASLDGERVEYRNRDGHAHWSGTSGNEAARFVVMSEINGSEATTRDGEAGSIEKVIAETRSGSTAMLAFDPDENFLGIADELKAVPFSIVTIAPDGKVRIDANKRALMNAEPIPADVADFDDDRERNAVYAAFDTEPQRFKTERPYKELKGWGPDSELAKQMRRTNRRAHRHTIEGEVVRIGQMSNDSMAEGCTVTIETDDGQKTVLLAPTEIVKDNGFEPDDGDQVSIAAQQINLHGNQLWIARSCTINGKTHRLWDQNDRPLYVASR